MGLALTAAVSSCLFPEKFEASVEVHRDGTFSYVYDGVLTFVPARAAKLQGPYGPVVERAMAELARQLRDELGCEKALHRGGGELEVVCRRSGRLTGPVYFLSPQLEIFSIRPVGPSTVELRGMQLTPRDVVEAGRLQLALDGTLRITTDGAVTSHNATEETSWFGASGAYVWKLEMLPKDMPRMVVDLSQAAAPGGNDAAHEAPPAEPALGLAAAVAADGSCKDSWERVRESLMQLEPPPVLAVGVVPGGDPMNLMSRSGECAPDGKCPDDPVIGRLEPGTRYQVTGISAWTYGGPRLRVRTADDRAGWIAYYPGPTALTGQTDTGAFLLANHSSLKESEGRPDMAEERARNFERYLELFPEGRHRAAARLQAASFWATAVRAHLDPPDGLAADPSAAAKRMARVRELLCALTADGAHRCIRQDAAGILDRAGAPSRPIRLASPVGGNPYLLPIASVLDHSSPKAFYGKDGVVAAYSGERGVRGAHGKVCGPSGKPCGFLQESGGKFTVTGAYAGVNADCTASGEAPGCLLQRGVLNYDGHPGYDYVAEAGTPIRAAHAGLLDIPTDDWINGSGPAGGDPARKERARDPHEGFNTLRIVHVERGRPTGWETWYLHASAGSETVAPGERHPVRAGEQIALVGATGTGSRHLHFEVRWRGVRGDAGVCVERGLAVDPYGWDETCVSDPLNQHPQALHPASLPPSEPAPWSLWGPELLAEAAIERALGAAYRPAGDEESHPHLLANRRGPGQPPFRPFVAQADVDGDCRRDVVSVAVRRDDPRDRKLVVAFGARPAAPEVRPLAAPHPVAIELEKRWPVRRVGVGPGGLPVVETVFGKAPEARKGSNVVLVYADPYWKVLDLQDDVMPEAWLDAAGAKWLFEPPR